MWLEGLAQSGLSFTAHVAPLSCSPEYVGVVMTHRHRKPSLAEQSPPLLSQLANVLRGLGLGCFHCMWGVGQGSWGGAGLGAR